MKQSADERRAELLDGLGAYSIPAPPRVKPKPRNPDATYTVVLNDFHFGEGTSDPDAQAITLQVVADLQPDAVVLNGDLADCYALSKYSKDARHKGPLSAERRHMAEYLHQLHGAFGGRILETNANHSGNGTESRWWRYLSERIPEMLEMPEVVQALDYRKVWHPSWSRVELVDMHTICPGLIVLHGDVVRSHAAYSARGMLEKWRHSLICGHTHRIGMYGYRVPAVAEKREHQMRAWENGCLCRLDAPYLATTNWQQAFSIVRSADDGHFTVEQVLIQSGRAECLTTGGTYRA